MKRLRTFCVAVLLLTVYLFLVHLNNGAPLYDFDQIFNLYSSPPPVMSEKENLTLDDIFISIKTAKKFHQSRIIYIMETWFKLAKKQTYIFTDGDDDQLNRLANGHLVNTHCGEGKGYAQLGCKMGTEYDAFLASGKKWWCRFDDDNYVNPTRLLELVQRFDWTSDVCIGRLSVPHFDTDFHGKHYRYSFPHGGAGCCISRPLGWKMKPWCGREELVKTQNGMADDCAIGFIITALLKVNITLTDLLHSDNERLTDLDPSTFHKQVSFGWSSDKINKIQIKNVTHNKVFDEDQDPSRFYSLHCLIYPATDFCN